ncbi:MAG: hypothetical protein ACQPRH_04365 [Solitalea-like symbiont of Tyrophagus putrescentiae]
MHTSTITYLVILVIALILILIFYAITLKNNIHNFLRDYKNSRGISDIQSLKIQASERFMLLTERINPISLLHRISPIGKNAQEYRLELITEIQSEYNHNIAWQLYINDNLALLLKHILNETMLSINMAANKLPEGASSIDLSKNIVAEQANRKGDLYFQFQSSLRKYIN